MILILEISFSLIEIETSPIIAWEEFLKKKKKKKKKKSRAHSSDTICNSPSTSLVDIVRVNPIHIVISLTILKTCLLRKNFYTFIKNVLFSFPTDVGSGSPTLRE